MALSNGKWEMYIFVSVFGCQKLTSLSRTIQFCQLLPNIQENKVQLTTRQKANSNGLGSGLIIRLVLVYCSNCNYSVEAYLQWSPGKLTALNILIPS
jgi:hypothetical protein